MPHRAIVLVTLPRAGLLPVDHVTNTWHFEADDDGTFLQRVAGLQQRVQNFYSGIASNLSNTLAGKINIRIYNWADPTPRVPLTNFTGDLAKGAAAMASEVALCLSYAASPESGTSQARRRGRIYLGPFTTSLGVIDGSDLRPKQSEISAMLVQAQALATGTGGAFRLAIYSPRTKALGGSDDEAWTDATQLSMDNAFDTIRSRGARSTTRTVVPVI